MLRTNLLNQSGVGAAAFHPSVDTASADHESAGIAMLSGLRAQTPSCMPDSSAFGVPPAELRRYRNLQYVQATFLSTQAPIGGETRVNANLISPKTIAMLAPLHDKPQYMAALAGAMLDHKVGLIVDLTTSLEQSQRNLKYRDGGNYPCASGAVANFKVVGRECSADEIAKHAIERRLEVDLALPGGQSHGKAAISYLNCPINDSDVMPPQDLYNLVRHMRDWRTMNQGQSIAIHCTSGTGRTGLVTTAERLLNLHDSGLLTADNRDKLLQSEILHGRSQRSDVMVNKSSQCATLLAFADFLLSTNRRSAVGQAPSNYPNITESASSAPPRVHSDSRNFRHSEFRGDDDHFGADAQGSTSSPLRQLATDAASLSMHKPMDSIFGSVARRPIAGAAARSAGTAGAVAPADVPPISPQYSDTQVPVYAKVNRQLLRSGAAPGLAATAGSAASANVPPISQQTSDTQGHGQVAFHRPIAPQRPISIFPPDPTELPLPPKATFPPAEKDVRGTVYQNATPDGRPIPAKRRVPTPNTQP
jgi:protein tyrosine phosphatase